MLLHANNNNAACVVCVRAGSFHRHVLLAAANSKARASSAFK
jgi:hypothetical protein